MIWMDADVGDQERFPARVIPTGGEASPLLGGDEIDLGPSPLGGTGDFDAFLRRTDSTSFLVLHDDGVVYEQYFGGPTGGHCIPPGPWPSRSCPRSWGSPSTKG
jgi:hypothetical protein